MDRDLPVWPVQDAKARFSELLDLCVSEGAQMVTKRGREAAVLVPVEEWRKLTAKRGRSLKSVLLGDGPRFDLQLPKRGQTRRRSAQAFD
jgi:antitoxin Phd